MVKRTTSSISQTENKDSIDSPSSADITSSSCRDGGGSDTLSSQLVELVTRLITEANPDRDHITVEFSFKSFCKKNNQV